MTLYCLASKKKSALKRIPDLLIYSRTSFNCGLGGGQLAHTILGVDFNPDTGDCAFLVLDPHYTGEDLIQPVLSKGWCGWKTPGFWKPEYFYNLLLPTPPSNII